jgi:hypothetical protein
MGTAAPDTGRNGCSGQSLHPNVEKHDVRMGHQSSVRKEGEKPGLAWGIQLYDGRLRRPLRRTREAGPPEEHF